MKFQRVCLEEPIKRKWLIVVCNKCHDVLSHSFIHSFIHSFSWSLVVGLWIHPFHTVLYNTQFCSTTSIRLKLSEGVHQRVRIRLREVGKHLKGLEQVQSEIKYELEDDAVIGTEWTPISILISKYANTARKGVVLQISHVLEITMIGGTQSIHFVNIPITLQ